MAAAAGTALVAVAEKLRVPSIALLLLGGVLLGPEGLGLVRPEVLGRGIETVVGIAVAIILFEGGLTLDLGGFRRAPSVIIRMLTLGVMVTWAATAAAVYYILALPLPLAILAGSMAIVTGPTVISPLLRRTGVKPRLHHILYWEGVVVDAVGVFAAVMCFEWIASTGDEAMLLPLGRFFSRFAIGVGIGAVLGLVVAEVLRRNWVAAGHANIICVGAALIGFGGANSVLHEAGILTVIVAGLVINLRAAPILADVKRFELELTELGIGLLFILLAAKLELSSFADAGMPLLWVVVAVVVGVRPLSIAVSTFRQGLSIRERMFLSWVAPRGIVAASMASLFSIRLTATGHPEAATLEIIVFAIIGATVLVQGLSTPLVARLLGLVKAKRAPIVLAGHQAIVSELHLRLREAGAPSVALGPGRAASQSGEHQRQQEDAAAHINFSDVEEVLVIEDGTNRLAATLSEFRDAIGEAALRTWSDIPEGAHHVFMDALSPRAAAEGLNTNTLAIELVDVGDASMRTRFGERLYPLLAITDRGAQVIDGAIPLEATKVVALRSRVPGLYGLIRDATVLDRPDLSFRAVVHELLTLAKLTTKGLDVEARTNEIMEREAGVSTALGNGIAVPHLYVKDLDRSVVLVGLAPGGTDIDGPDGAVVKLVFLLLSPQGDPTQHLRGLAALAGLAIDRQLATLVAQQRTKAAVLALLRERE